MYMRIGSVWQWVGLLVSSVLLAWCLHTGQIPAALLLGPMLCAIAAGVAGASVRVPRVGFIGAQAIVGCLIARSITGEIVVSVAQDWPAMMLAAGSTIAAGGVVGWALGRFGTLPGSAAAWGTCPGGASAMVAMAEEFGADPRLVAFMQYARVVCVVVCASLVARLVFGVAPHAVAPDAPQGASHLAGDAARLAGTLALAIGGSWLGRVLNIPAGGLLAPMLIGSVLHATGLLDILLPEPLLATAYAMIGWYIGLRFTRETLGHVVRAIPQVLLASLATIALGALSAWVLVLVRHTDPLTAFLATSPGGIDSVAIIAVGSQADISFVMALQTLRVLLVLFTGPALARLIARSSRRP
jgi:membrane AbrB-like protein